VPGRTPGVKMVRMAQVGAPISKDGVADHPDCWCICLCYLHFASENTENGEQRYMFGYHPVETPIKPRLLLVGNGRR